MLFIILTLINLNLTLGQSQDDPYNGINNTVVLCSITEICSTSEDSLNPTTPIRDSSTSIGLRSTGSGLPIWDVVRVELRWLFLLHAYGFACSFFILAFYAFFSILNIRSLISNRPFMSTINVFLCLLGVSRASCLFIDPYQLKNVMPKMLGSIMWDIGYTSIMAAFALVQLAFLQLTQLKLGPKQLRSKSCISIIITTHFTCAVGLDVVMTFHSQLQVLRYAVRTVFLIWGLILCCTFVHAGRRVRTVLKNMPAAVLLQRDLAADANCKGIMQLAMLAPYNNLASSVAAAFIPTLLLPKFAGMNTATASDGIKNETDGLNESQETNNSAPAGSTLVRSPSALSASSLAVTKPKQSILTTSRTGSTRSTKGTYSLLQQQSTSNNSSPAHNSVSGVNVIINNNAIPSTSSSPATTLIGSRKNNENIADNSMITPSQSVDSVKLKKNLSWGNNRLHPNPYSGNTDKDTVLNKTKGSIIKRTKTSSEISSEDDNNEDGIDDDKLSVMKTLLPQSGSSLSIKQKRSMAQTDPKNDDNTITDSSVPDLTLHTILNHIAYVNRAATHSESGLAHTVPQPTPATRKQQVISVLRITYATAIAGLILCAADIFRLYGPYGLYNRRGSPIAPWPWFLFETVCRIMELAMGCAMANITKQPTPRERFIHQGHRSIHHSMGMGLKHRESLFI